VLNSLIHSIVPTDVLDIVATSVLIYYLVLLIRGTRAVQILTGVLVLVALLGFATFLNLLLLGTILKLALLGAAVSLPIIFQPELRRALESMRSSFIRPSFFSGQSDWMRIFRFGYNK